MTTEDRTLGGSAGTRRRSANRLHLWRFLMHPDRLASLTPSSPTLCRRVAEQVRRREDEFVVELGPGTGAVTRALLAAGVPADKLIAVEIDRQMARFLRRTYPDITVVEGDALDLERSPAAPAVGRVGTVICGIPASLLPIERQRALVRVMFALMPAGRRFLAYSFRLASPFPEAQVGLVGTRLAFTWRNLPPASVWGYVANGGG